MMIADVHNHVFPPRIAEQAAASISQFYHATASHTATLDILLEQEALAGIHYTAVCSSATNAHQVSHINDFISQCVRSAPNLVGIGTLYPTMEGWEAELERIPELGIRGLKIHPDFQQVPIDEPKALDMYRAIAKAGLPVLFHIGDSRYDFSSPHRLVNLIRQVPDLIVIAAHFGGWHSPNHHCVYDLPENVYFDTSSSIKSMGNDRALMCLERIGAHRFLFGTDFPMWTPKTELQRLLALQLDSSTLQKILFDNFQALFLRDCAAQTGGSGLG